MTPNEAKEAIEIMDVFHSNYDTVGERRSQNGNYRWPRDLSSAYTNFNRRRNPSEYYSPEFDQYDRSFILLVRVSVNMSVLITATNQGWDPVDIELMKVQCVFWVRDNGTKCLTDLTDGKVWELR